MQPVKYLAEWLEQNANQDRYLFSYHDLRTLYPNISELAFKTLLSRAAKSSYLIRICRGLYGYKKFVQSTGLVLFHAAAYIRSDKFNYISLETVLSDLGVISQIPINWVSIMSSGRSNIISCGNLGNIEFIHTDQKAESVANDIVFDVNCRLWRANLSLALRDMRLTRRNSDLIDWSIVNELI
jgi:hypothetical protein